MEGSHVCIGAIQGDGRGAEVWRFGCAPMAQLATPRALFEADQAGTAIAPTDRMSPKPSTLVALAAVAVLSTACGSSGVVAKAPPPAPAAQPEVAKIVSAMRADLDACYAEGRRLNPMLEGGLVAEVKVGAAGGVESVDAQDVEGLNRAVIGCITKRVQSARFPAPGEKGATVRIPLRFKA